MDVSFNSTFTLITLGTVLSVYAYSVSNGCSKDASLAFGSFSGIVFLMLKIRLLSYPELDKKSDENLVEILFILFLASCLFYVTKDENSIQQLQIGI